MTAAGPVELPPLLWHTAFPDLGQWIEAIWWQYEAMVYQTGLTLFGRQLCSSGRGRAPDGRDDAFWHLITDGGGPGQRSLSLYKGAMIGRVWQVLEWAADEDPRAIAWWDVGRRHRIVVAPADYSLRVVLSESRQRLALLSAYPAGSEADRRRLRRRAAAAGVVTVERMPEE